jgi:hypothetical protein
MSGHVRVAMIATVLVPCSSDDTIPAELDQQLQSAKKQRNRAISDPKQLQQHPPVHHRPSLQVERMESFDHPSK